MNEINIKIILKKDDVIFPSCFVGQFLDIVLGILNTYEIETEDIHDMRLVQNIDLNHIPFVLDGKCKKDTYAKFKKYQHPSQKGEPDE